MNYTSTKMPKFAAPLIIALLALIAHTLYSSLGYNPTDDGFILAMSRRILEGQIPHRDFISIRPIGSPLLHSFEVLLSGKYTYLVSRLIVWLQISTYSYLCVQIYNRQLKLALSFTQNIALVMITFMLNVGVFPIMAWHSIDGLFFIFLGLFLILKNTPSTIISGYFIVSLSYLCKQNFLPIPLLFLLILGHWKGVFYWIACLLPAVIYIVVIDFDGGLTDFIANMLIQTDIIRVGFANYIKMNLFLGLGSGLILALLSFSEKLSKNQIKNIIVVACLLGFSVTSTVILAHFYPNKILFGHPSLFLFGMTLSVTFYSAFENRWDFVKIAVLILAIAWCSSLSVGKPHPGLLAGSLACLCLVAIQMQDYRQFNKYMTPILLVTCLGTLSCFHFLRTHFIYRQPPSTHLIYPLDDLLPGGDGIYTDKTTYEYFTDLQHLMTDLKGLQISLLPDTAGFWVKASVTNPLAIDWVQNIELNEPLQSQILKQLTLKRDPKHFRIILEKYEAASLGTNKRPIDPSDFVVHYVRNNFTKIRETPYFEVYQ